MATTQEIEREIEQLEREKTDKQHKLDEETGSLKREIEKTQEKIDDKRREAMRLHQQELGAAKKKTS